MQDLSRYKKKEYLEINTKYISLLAVGSIVLIALVFSMGLLIGSRQKSKKTICPETDLLTELNRQSKEPNPPKEVIKPSYYDTLTTKTDAVPTPASLKFKNDDQNKNVSEKILLKNVALETPREQESPVPENVKENEDGIYTLQVGSFQDQREASLMVKKLERAGHSAFLVSVNMPQRGGLWYRVRIGPFKSKRTAWNYKKNFEQKEHLSAFVVKKRS
jgi:cell division septation protein DedD